MSTSTHLNPSQTSSQRTSLETATLSRSSTQVSPTLDPARTSSVSSTTTQTASARRNRAALRDFYGLQNQKQQEQQGGNGTAESNAFHEEPYASHLDETAFNREEYVSHLLRTSDLAHILRTESALISEIRSLDGDRKALVYDNYSKLITATETIRRMKANMQPLAPTASTLSPAISHIAVTAEVLVRGRADGDQEAEGQRRRKGQVDTVRWVLGAPERYEDALEKKGSNREDVEEDWAQVKRLLDVWEKNGAEGAKKVKSACEKVLGSMT